MNQRPEKDSSMAPNFATAYRTHTCGEISESLIGQQVKLCGVMDRYLRANVFVVRDTYGEVIVALNESGVALLEKQLGDDEITPESVVTVEGKVARSENDDALCIDAEAASLESFANAPLLFDFRSEHVERWDRIRYRYLYLRNKEMHENLKFRTDLVHGLRSHLVEEQFDELNHPILSGRYTDTTGQQYFAIRDNQQIYGLPGRHPIHASLVMAAGYDRAFEIGRRFIRKESYGPFEQPEYTVLDMSLAFLGLKELSQFARDFLSHLWNGILGHEEPLPLYEMTHAEAKRRFGTANPDMRCQIEVLNADLFARDCRSWKLRQRIAEGGAVRAMSLPRAGRLFRRLGDLQALKAADEGLELYAYRMEDGGVMRPLVEGEFDESLALEIARNLRSKFGDLLLIATGPNPDAVNDLMGTLRDRSTEAFEIHDLPFAFAMITELPMVESQVEGEAAQLRCDPLTQPHPADADAELMALRGQNFILNLNGVQIGSGHIRHHELGQLRRQFRRFGLSGMEIDARYGVLLDALQYGLPPHGRLAFGIERLTALLLGLDSIEEVIALPKVWDGSDPLVRSPWPMDDALLRGLLGV